MERRAYFIDGCAHHIEQVSGSLVVTVTSFADHINIGDMRASAVKITIVVHHSGRSIVTMGPKVFRLGPTNTRKSYIDTYSLSIGRQKLRIGFAGKETYQNGPIPKYMYVKFEQD